MSTIQYRSKYPSFVYVITMET